MSKEQSEVTDDGISIGEIAEKLSTTSFWLSIVSFLSQISEQIKSILNRIFGDSIHRLTSGIKSMRELFYIFLYSRIIRAPAFILIILLISAGWMGNSANCQMIENSLRNRVGPDATSSRRNFSRCKVQELGSLRVQNTRLNGFIFLMHAHL